MKNLEQERRQGRHLVDSVFVTNRQWNKNILKSQKTLLIVLTQISLVFPNIHRDNLDEHKKKKNRFKTEEQKKRFYEIIRMGVSNK